MVKYSILLVVISVLGTLDRGDAIVCTLSEDCTLPCQIQYGAEVLIHWLKQDSTPVHSYYDGKDQLNRQDPHFRGRTSMFHDQIPKGNASLKLKEVNIQDQGDYKCYYSTISSNLEKWIKVQVEAPPRKVDFQLEGNKISCSSEKIYPQPKLTWSFSPPSSQATPEPTVTETEQLYSISSSLMVSDNLDYTCTISNGISKQTATLFKQASISSSDTETTIPCTPKTIPLESLRWRFNNSVIILTKTTPHDSSVTDKWRKHVKAVSNTGSLSLQELSPNQGGVYTCELKAAEETNIQSTVLVIKESQGALNVGAIIAGVVVSILFLVGLIFGLIYIFKDHICDKKKSPKPQDTETLKSNGTGSATAKKDAPPTKRLLTTDSETARHSSDEGNDHGYTPVRKSSLEKSPSNNQDVV